MAHKKKKGVSKKAKYSKLLDQAVTIASTAAVTLGAIQALVKKKK